MKHTPGPWYPVGYWVEVENDRYSDICTCDPSVLGQDHIEGADERATMNARLIAAAPDMLTALKVLVTLFPKNAPETIKAKEIIKAATGNKP